MLGLQNDRKAMTKEIESSLEKFHQRMKDQDQGTPMDVDDTSSTTQSEAIQPIAKVNLVSEGSPAFHAVSTKLRC